jgi:hypothetical protein
MENIIDLIATDAPASEISDAIKAALYTKAAENIDSVRPFVADSLFGNNDIQNDNEYSQDNE